MPFQSVFCQQSQCDYSHMVDRSSYQAYKYFVTTSLPAGWS